MVRGFTAFLVLLGLCGRSVADQVVWDGTGSPPGLSASFLPLNSSSTYAISFSFVEGDTSCGPGAYVLSSLTLGLGRSGGDIASSLFIALYSTASDGSPATPVSLQAVPVAAGSAASLVTIPLPETFAVDISANPGQGYAILIQPAVRSLHAVGLACLPGSYPFSPPVGQSRVVSPQHVGRTDRRPGPHHGHVAAGSQQLILGPRLGRRGSPHWRQDGMLAHPLPDPHGLAERDPLRLGLVEHQPDTECVCDSLVDADPEQQPVALIVSDGEHERDCKREPGAHGHGICDAQHLGLPLPVVVAVGLCHWIPVAVTDALGLELRLLDCNGERIALRDALAERDPVRDAESVAFAVSDGSPGRARVVQHGRRRCNSARTAPGRCLQCHACRQRVDGDRVGVPRD